MAIVAGLSGARAVLLASQLCASGQVTGLARLQAQFPSALPLERVLRLLLTFLPESTEPQQYTPVLEELVDGSHSGCVGDGDVDVSSVKDLSEAAVRKRVGRIRLLPLKHREDDSQEADLLVQFLIHRAYRIDSETSLQPFILDLLLPFYRRSSFLRTWLISSLLPLLRVNYEYYPNQDDTFALDVIESMDDGTAVNVFLSMTGFQGVNNSMDLVRNLRGLIGPWLYGSNRAKRRRLNETAQRDSILLPDQDRTTEHGWLSVNEWLLSRSLVDFESVVSAFTNWDGPQDVDLGGYEDGQFSKTESNETDLRFRHGQCGLAVVYANSDTSRETLDGSARIVERISTLLSITSDVIPSTGFADTISSTSRASLLQNALLGPSNPLTRPSEASISFLRAVIQSVQILNDLGYPVTCRAAANMCLHSTADMQLSELRNVMASILRTKGDWEVICRQLVWLCEWNGRQDYHGLYWRIPRDALDMEILKILLEAKGEYIYICLDCPVLTEPEYQMAVGSTSQHDPTLVEAAVNEAIYKAYDNASNGNRTRGGMKKAYDMLVVQTQAIPDPDYQLAKPTNSLQTFQPHFPGSASFKQLQALISATHAFSFYSLTLQHGVPFQPVSIRIHPDPLSLIEKVLEQNPKGYTKLDDLLSIGRNLVAAGFPPMPDDTTSTPTEDQDATLIAERRITSLAISSALALNDFGTAYSYIFTRLAPSTSTSTDPTTTKDDISWRAVYTAGRYRPPPSPSQTPSSEITHLTQRMELLSLSLILVPTAHPLPEILGAWRRCDEELSNLLARESAQEDLWDSRGDSVSMSTLPGGFGTETDKEQDVLDTRQQHVRRARVNQGLGLHAGSSGEQEAPMGLFEVARGAASALQKNAFASGGPGRRERVVAPGQDEDGDEHDDRVRKRDVVSNMVTGGLASGIGWVLGAQPNR